MCRRRGLLLFGEGGEEGVNELGEGPLQQAAAEGRRAAELRLLVASRCVGEAFDQAFDQIRGLRSGRNVRPVDRRRRV